MLTAVPMAEPKAEPKEDPKEEPALKAGKEVRPWVLGFEALRVICFRGWNSNVVFSLSLTKTSLPTGSGFVPHPDQ